MCVKANQLTSADYKWIHALWIASQTVSHEALNLTILNDRCDGQRELIKTALNEYIFFFID